MHRSRGVGGGVRGGGPDPPPPPPPPFENQNTIGLLSNTGPDRLENQSYQASIQCWAIISPLAKRHFNGASLFGRWCPTFSGICLDHLSSPQLKIHNNKKKKTTTSELDPYWQNFLDPCMIFFMGGLCILDFNRTNSTVQNLLSSVFKDLNFTF